MGRALLCAPFFPTVVLAANTLIQSGDDSAKKAHLPGIASGETIATVAYTEPSGKWDESGVEMAARAPVDSGFTLSGTKMYVLDGLNAHSHHRRRPHRCGGEPVRRRRKRRPDSPARRCRP